MKLFVFGRGSKRHKSKLRELKILQAEWDPDYSYAKYAAYYSRGYRKLEPSENKPQYVQKYGYRPSAVPYILAEGRKAKSRKLKALHSDRYPDYRDTPEKTDHSPAKAEYYPAKQEPDDIP
jgi:hypothetical protein